MDVYGEIARDYDLIYGDLHDLEFYLNEARNARGSVLEIACGTGRILLQLLKQGIDITGMDLSEEMLGVLRKKAESMGLDPKLMKADMRDFRIEQKFKLIIVPYRSFLHLHTDEDRKKALERFMEHLAPGGRLILHVYNPSPEEFEMGDGYHPFETETLSDPEGKPYRLDWYLNYDKKQQRARYRVTITSQGQDQRNFDMEISFVSIRKMEELLKGTGFRNIRKYCGFSYELFHDGCREVVWFAEK